MFSSSSLGGGGSNARFLALVVTCCAALVWVSVRMGGRGASARAGISSLENGLVQFPTTTIDIETMKQTDHAAAEKWYPTFELEENEARGKESTVRASSSEAAMAPQAADAQVHVDIDSMFEDRDAYDRAPFIKVRTESKTLSYAKNTLYCERTFRKNPTKLYVPRLKRSAQLSIDQFVQRFMFTGQPVIIPFEAMRHLDFTMQGYTLDELLSMYPNHKKGIYTYGAFTPNREIDLGPAVAELKKDNRLKRRGPAAIIPAT